jgi:protein phosphatase
VDDQFRGTAVQCGGCGKPFAVPAPTGSWFGGLHKVMQSLTGAGKPAEEDVSVSLELDGPAAQTVDERQGEPPAVVVPRLEVGAATSSGVVRPRNEDSYLIQQWACCNRDEPGDVAVLAVADGMGGHAAGDLASGLVIRTLAGPLGALALRLTPFVAPAQPTPAEAASVVGEAILAANRATLQKGQSDAACQGMGATVAVVVAWQAQAVVAHVGDCRVYHWHDGKMKQLTRDHTVVGRMVELGKLTPAESKTHPARNELTQAIGRHPQVEPSSQQVMLAPGDWLITACDGLHTHVEESDLAGMIVGASSAARLASNLVETANQRGGSDNCTVLALRCRG